MADTPETRPARATDSRLSATADTKPWDTSALIQGTIDELHRMLDAQHVVGEPMTFGTATIVPLVSLGFGFGAGGGGGGGTSPDGNDGEGGGGGGGGAGGVKPIACLIIEDGAVRLESIPGEPSGLDKLGTAIASALENRKGKPDAKSGD